MKIWLFIFVRMSCQNGRTFQIHRNAYCVHCFICSVLRFVTAWLNWPPFKFNTVLHLLRWCYTNFVKMFAPNGFRISDDWCQFIFVICYAWFCVKCRMSSTQYWCRISQYLTVIKKYYILTESFSPLDPFLNCTHILHRRIGQGIWYLRFQQSC